jgi:cytochrome oxidase Cu insertion factor (SCO1/SenC/PrrC family)
MDSLATRACGRRLARRSVVASVLVLAVTALGSAPPARADGDPASDYLWNRSLFVPTGTSSSERIRLQALVDAARAGGLPIKVAVIGSVYDLGSITPLWRRPQQYARFLGVELSNRFHGLLLVAMPNGFGLYAGPASVASEEATLRALRPTAGGGGLLAAASRAVRSIAATDGDPIAEIPGAGPGSGGSSGLGVPAIAAAIAGVLAVTGLAAAIVLLLRRRGRWRAAITVSTLVVVVLAVAGALAFSHSRGGSGASAASAASAAGSVGSGQGFTWPAGQRPAPPFVLRDQSGRNVTPRAGGDRLTIVAFVDPVCRAFCPLEAAVLGGVERALPAARRPAIVAVSVDPWGDARANLITDIRKWQTGPAWRWAVGPRATLERVWNDYQVGVQVKVARVAGTTVHEVSHDEMIYVIDGNGFERVVWPWPFTQAELIGSIHRLQA